MATTDPAPARPGPDDATAPGTAGGGRGASVSALVDDHPRTARPVVRIKDASVPGPGAGGGRVEGGAAGGGGAAATDADGVDVTANLGGLRQSYEHGHLDEHDLAPTWVEQFARWFADASAEGSGVGEPNAMVFATADERGRPSARTVLLKGFSAEGFVLFTNYTSRKGRESAANPYGSLVFPWYPLERQVVVVGEVERVSRARSAEYFHSRPRGSQLGSWASRQSTVLSSRAELEHRDAQVAGRWPEGTEIPMPPFWGGLLIVPESVEFWQGRPDRLHDRLRFRRVGDPRPDASAGPAAWTTERLSP
jgi:pyridoxamine 5'-phosphate oxidase